MCEELSEKVRDGERVGMGLQKEAAAVLARLE